MNDDLKRITILHSNDIHGQFTGETGFGIRPEELIAGEKGMWIASPDAFLTLQDYLSGHQGLGSRIDDRCIIRGNVGGLALEVKSGKRKRGLLG